MTPLALCLLLHLASLEAGIPPGLLHAVVLRESGGRPGLVTPERGGHCSVGLGQVLVRGCRPAAVRRLLVPAENLRASCAVLVRARHTCWLHPRWQCCRTHYVGAYNSGARGYAERVLAVWHRLLWRRGGEA